MKKAITLFLSMFILVSIMTLSGNCIQPNLVVHLVSVGGKPIAPLPNAKFVVYVRSKPEAKVLIQAETKTALPIRIVLQPGIYYVSAEETWISSNPNLLSQITNFRKSSSPMEVKVTYLNTIYLKMIGDAERQKEMIKNKAGQMR